MRPFIVAVALAAAVPAAGAQAVAISVEELARHSDAVVRGRVTSARSHRSEDGRRIFTSYEIQPAAVLRGSAPGRARVVVPGGVVGRMAQRVDAAPVLTVGEQVVVFLQDAGGGSFHVTGLAQGKFSVAGQSARPNLSGLMFVKTSVRAGERRVEEMPLGELERRVRGTR